MQKFNEQNIKHFERLQIDFPQSEKCRTTVVIPVRDESELITKTLEKFLCQKDRRGGKLDFATFEILVLANNCRDDSAEIIKNFARRYPQINLHLTSLELTPEQANIGFVRRLLFNEAFVRQAARDGVLLTTDGDTEVSDDWITANLRELETGAEAVGGRILLKDGELEKLDAATRDFHLKDEEYRLQIAALEGLYDFCEHDPNPRHHQHFNGSFAVKASTFARSGGIPDVKFLEDCAFFNALQRIDAKFRHSPQVKVRTSARCVGRSEVGLSFQLNEWRKIGAAGKDFLVESPSAAVERFKLCSRLREFHRTGADENLIKDLSEKSHVSTEFFRRETSFSQPFGKFYEEFRHEQNQVCRQENLLVSLNEALRELANTAAIFPKHRADIFRF